MDPTVIHNTTIVTACADGTVHYDAALAVEGRRIAEIGPSEAILGRFPGAQRIDGRGKVLMPGFANCHTHFIRLLARGVFEDQPTLKKPPFTRQGRLGFPKLKPEERQTMARLACLEAIRGGTTLIMDIAANIDDYAEAAAASGLRLVFAEQAADRAKGAQVGEPGRFEADPQAAARAVARIQALHQKWNGAEDGRIAVAVAAHAPDMCSPALLKELRGLQERLDTVATIHLSQYWAEVEMIRENYGRLPTEYLRDNGFLQERLIAAHCRCMTEAEMEMLGRSGTIVCFNPTIGARGGYMPNMGRLKSAGAPIVMGTDERSQDMVEVVRTGLFTERLRAGDGAALAPSEALSWATANGYRALGVADGGMLKEGNRADLIVIDALRPHLVPTLRIVSTFVHNGQAGDVEAVMVDGRWLMRERRVLTLDEDRIVREAEEIGYRLWQEEFSRAPERRPSGVNPGRPNLPS